MLEKPLESSLDSKEIKPVHPKENQSWIFTTLATWCKELTHWKRPCGKDWRQKVKGTTENEMVGWHHWLDGHEFEQAPGAGDGQGSLECCSPWGGRPTEQLNWIFQFIQPLLLPLPPTSTSNLSFYSYHANSSIYVMLLNYTCAFDCYICIFLIIIQKYLFPLSLWVYFSLTWDLPLTCSSQWNVTWHDQRFEEFLCNWAYYFVPLSFS